MAAGDAYPSRVRAAGGEHTFGIAPGMGRKSKVKVLLEPKQTESTTKGLGMAKSVGHCTSAWPDGVVPIAVEVVPVEFRSRESLADIFLPIG